MKQKRETWRIIRSCLLHLRAVEVIIWTGIHISQAKIHHHQFRSFPLLVRCRGVQFTMACCVLTKHIQQHYLFCQGRKTIAQFNVLINKPYSLYPGCICISSSPSIRATTLPGSGMDGISEVGKEHIQIRDILHKLPGTYKHTTMKHLTHNRIRHRQRHLSPSSWILVPLRSFAFIVSRPLKSSSLPYIQTCWGHTRKLRLWATSFCLALASLLRIWCRSSKTFAIIPWQGVLCYHELVL